MKLKILCWNVWVEGYFDQIADFLKRSNADIIGLQEVQADDPKREVIKYLTTLGYEHVFVPVQKTWGGKTWNDGPAIFSKFPIVKSETYLLSKTKGRAAIRADIQVNDLVLHVFNTHLMHNHQQEQSDEQVEQGINLIHKLTGERTILMGDLNAMPESRVIQNIKKVLVDSDPASTPTWSVYPEGCTICKPQHLDIRLDYIFTTKDLKTSEFKVGDSKASDHLPISVTVQV